MELLEDANEYVDEKSFRMAWSGGIQMIYNLDDFRDINTYDEIKKAPPGFEEGVYPYFTHIGEQLQERMQTLALAYAISQKEEYGKRLSIIHRPILILSFRSILFNSADKRCVIRRIKKN